ncbi:hypothetical protein N0Y54_00065 [Nostoc punctiforme UO1]|uniref:hypothetical protein n=1 Tax=Nostoc punctiforme TaxID=272131 RepID=UPI003098E659
MVKLKILKLAWWLTLLPMLSEWPHKQLARAILPSRAFYRRLRSRLGTPKAVTATAHKLARIFYLLWTTGGNYQDIGMDYYEQRYQERVINNLQKKALALGFELIPQPEANTVS